MVFASKKEYFKNEGAKRVNAILKCDLSSFEDTYSNDTSEKSIADSGFTLYGYSPDDYYQNKTSDFPKLSLQGDDWLFWSGSIHAQYKMDTTRALKKVNSYYEVYLLGVNNAVESGQELTFTFIPANEVGPDGQTMPENRILYGKSYFRPYHYN